MDKYRTELTTWYCINFKEDMKSSNSIMDIDHIQKFGKITHGQHRKYKKNALQFIGAERAPKRKNTRVMIIYDGYV